MLMMLGLLRALGGSRAADVHFPVTMASLMMLMIFDFDGLWGWEQPPLMITMLGLVEA